MFLPTCLGFVFSVISQVHNATMHQCMHKMSHKFAVVVIDLQIDSM